MIENCEPFVLQAEMGLSAKALGLLEKVIMASDLAGEIILPRVFYWSYTLITGELTINYNH
jgi:hypothetical protein